LPDSGSQFSISEKQKFRRQNGNKGGKRMSLRLQVTKKVAALNAVLGEGPEHFLDDVLKLKTEICIGARRKDIDYSTKCCPFCGGGIYCDHRVSEKIDIIRFFRIVLLDLVYGWHDQIRRNIQNDSFGVSLFCTGEARIVKGNGYGGWFLFASDPDDSVNKLLDNLMERATKQEQVKGLESNSHLRIKEIYQTLRDRKPCSHDLKYIISGTDSSRCLSWELEPPEGDFRCFSLS